MINLHQQASDTLSQLSLLTLDAGKTRRIMRSAGRKVRRESRGRLRQQEGLDNRKWKARKDGSKKRMLKRLGRHIKVMTNNDQVNIGYSQKRIGQVASAHQHGIDQSMTAAQAASYDKQNNDGHTSRRQAKALIKAGYQVRSGKRWKKPSIKWVTQNISSSQAGLILRILRNAPSKKEWDINLEKRSYLGQDRQEYKALTNLMLSEATRLS